MRLLKDKSEAVAKWVAARIPFVGKTGSFGPCVAIGVVSEKGEPLCGVVFHDWQPGFRTIAFSIASSSPRWATRSIVGKLLEYPFETAQVQKLWTATPSSNVAALRLVKGVGFTQEAVLARHFGKDHAVINRMFFNDYCRLYKEKDHGQTVASHAA